MNETLAKIGRFLFYNPWSSIGVIRSMLDLSRPDQELLRDEALFERLRIPSAGKRGYQVVYGLTGKGQQKLIGLYRPVPHLAEALLMQFDRLEQSRQLLVSLHQAGLLHWSISPWRVSQSAPYLDALASLSLGSRRRALAGLVSPMRHAAVDWYIDLVNSWARWRKAAGEIPAVLVFSTPPLSDEALHMLGEVAPAAPQNPAFWCSPEEIAKPGRWKPLKSHPMGLSAFQIWVSSGPAIDLEQKAYLKGARKSLPKKERSSILAWAGRDESELASRLACFLKVSSGQLELLETLCRFPCLSVEQYEKLYSGAKQARKLHYRLKALISDGWIIRLEKPHKLYLPEPKGLALMAGLCGVEPDTANRYLGFPVRDSRFQTQVEHHRVTADFMLRLLAEKSLAAWDFTASRYVFSDIHAPSRPEIRRLVILPDSDGGLYFSDARRCFFWLEVDRGTRKGKRIDAKLEKYFLAYYARLAWAHIPPVLYLVDTAPGRDEERLQEIVRRLEKLGKKYPGTSIRLLLTTGDLLHRSPEKLLDARIWRQFHSETYTPDLLSLRAAFEGIVL